MKRIKAAQPSHPMGVGIHTSMAAPAPANRTLNTEIWLGVIAHRASAELNARAQPCSRAAMGRRCMVGGSAAVSSIPLSELALTWLLQACLTGFASISSWMGWSLFSCICPLLNVLSNCFCLAPLIRFNGDFQLVISKYDNHLQLGIWAVCSDF